MRDTRFRAYVDFETAANAIAYTNASDIIHAQHVSAMGILGKSVSAERQLPSVLANFEAALQAIRVVGTPEMRALSQELADLVPSQISYPGEQGVMADKDRWRLLIDSHCEAARRELSATYRRR